MLATEVRRTLVDRAEDVPFHGWAHTDFVRRKAAGFAEDRGADVDLVEAAALVHDLNYIVEPASPPRVARDLRRSLLLQCGFTGDEIIRIEAIIDGAHTANRGPVVDNETACLSDADTLYKALPITPVLFSHRYLAENGMTLAELAKKITHEQARKLDDDYYFYDPRLSQTYRGWAKANLDLWQAIVESLSDPDVALLVEDAGG